MDFERRKAAAMASLGCTETDKSPKGTLDAPIIPLITTINNHPCFFTTSSCSGRISILAQPSDSTCTTKKKARGGTWLYISHDPADADSVLSLLFQRDANTLAATTSSQINGPCDLVFRFEPLIVAVECRDLPSAQSLVSTAIGCGFRESGITSANKRVIIAIRCSIRLEVPLGETGNIVVLPDYVRYLVQVANDKMEANRRRSNGFHQALLQEDGFGINCSKNVVNSLEGIEDLDVIDGQDWDSTSDKTGGHQMSHGCNLSVTRLNIVGESVEKLFLWGHSACNVKNRDITKVLVYGGFGGMGRHARRNDSLLLDPLHGTLELINTESTPSPRMGHTASLIRECMFVIGGRADPVNILNEVWMLNTVTNKWTLLNCNGFFPPRHRHAAATSGSKIYVFGGISNESMYSSIYVLDTNNLHWEELQVNGEQPCARHSHSMVSYKFQIFLFGGYDGENALGDLYSFDIQTHIWKQEKASGGGSPHARFSHSMFVYKHFVGIIGGCPVKQHFQELALFDLRSPSWKHVSLSSISKDLFVRSTVSIIGDDLVIVGGGASCYAFGTKFNEPMKVNLLALAAYDDPILSNNSKKIERTNPQNPGERYDLNYVEEKANTPQTQKGPLHWSLQFEKNNAKFGKDILKKFGWLDLGRKVSSSRDGTRICFPVTEKFSALFNQKMDCPDALEGLDELDLLKESVEGDLFNKISFSAALYLLKQCGGNIVADGTAAVKGSAVSPFMVIREAAAALIKQRGLSEDLLEQLPSRWDRLGDIVVLPQSCFKDPIWDVIGEQLWPIISEVLKTHRLARQGSVAPTGTRDSTLKMLLGHNGWVYHRENGILYSFDATKCMFSWGNLSEKLRMARLDCQGEVVVDLFAGIGYFVLPFLVRAKAKLVYACEWNPHAIEALRHNLEANSVADRCVVLEGDNRVTAPVGVAHRVCLGLIPSSEDSWATAINALRRDGGMLHVHANVKDSEETIWIEHVLKSLEEIVSSEGRCWEVVVEHVERVKWYAPHVRHLVADVRCGQTDKR